MRDRVAVIGVVLIEGGLEVPVDVLALDKEQRQTVHKADHVGPPAVETALNPQLAHAEEVVVLRFVKIKHPQSRMCPLALVVTERDRHPVAHQHIFLAVGGHDVLRCGGDGELLHRIGISGIGQARIQFNQFLVQLACQHHFAVGCAAQKTVLAEVFIVGVDRFPAELLLQAGDGGLLDECVFGVSHGLSDRLD